MFILRIILKTALLPVVLILIEAGIMGITIGTAVIEGLIDAGIIEHTKY